MKDNLREIGTAQAKNTASDTFYKLQFRIWTRFDPSGTELIEIVRAVYDGTALLSALEVTRAAAGLAEIDDPHIREQFETIAAAERILQKVSDLPESVRVRLHNALETQRSEKKAG